MVVMTCWKVGRFWNGKLVYTSLSAGSLAFGP